MLGLIYKDLILVRKNVLMGFLTIVGVALFALIMILGMNVGNFQELKEEELIYNLFYKGCILYVCGSGITVSLTSASAIDKDHKAEWYKVLYSSPVNVWKEIFSRYMVAFLVNTIMSIFSSIILPIIYMAGNEPYGFKEFKTVIYCWLAGLLIILIRLPIDIIFPAKISIVICCSLLGVFLVACMVWLMHEENIEVIFKTIKGWFDWIYNHGVLVVIAVVVASFSASYFCKRNRRWA
ncbi:MAG: hypothetical protein E7258_05015 [Lachnospiraceae bacterium]|nr:hypothetical protein [Lachnospiraceae bacterium]